MVQTLGFENEEHRFVAIQSASPLMPLAWLVLRLDQPGWSHTPSARKGELHVEVKTLQGDSIALVEKSKLRYLDKDAFVKVLQYAWRMAQLRAGCFGTSSTGAFSPKGVLRYKRRQGDSIGVHSVPRNEGQKMDLYEAHHKDHEDYPDKNLALPNQTSIADASRALLMGTQTNRGLENGCVVKRTCDPQYSQQGHALAGCCSSDMPYLDMCITMLVKSQELRQHRDYWNHEPYYDHTINFGKHEIGDVKSGSPVRRL